METKSILLVGVGGQGTILAAKMLTIGLMESGYDVKMSEIHGMSQRGGSVSSHVRYGTEVLSPVIEKGGADVIVSFEQMEAMRNLPYLKKDGIVIVADSKIPGLPVMLGKAPYPDGIISSLKEKCRTISFDAYSEAEKLGTSKCMNVILLGSTVRIMGLEHINWHDIISKNVKPQFVDLNLKAFDLGLKLAEEK